MVLVRHGVKATRAEWVAAGEPARARANFATLLAWIDEGRLKPHVFKTYALEETPAALRALLSRETTGKVVIAVR